MAAWSGPGGRALTEVDCPVSVMCYVTLLPVWCLCAERSTAVNDGGTHPTATVKHMLTCLVCSSAI